jgi:hypothetical protein
MTGAGEARGGNGPAVGDQRRGFAGGNDFHGFAANSTDVV